MTDVVKMCDVIDNCTECPRCGDDCDGERLYTHEEAWGMSDYISRADAMAELREWVKRANENGETPTWNDAVSLIGSLPSAELPKGDLISRADAIEAVRKVVIDNDAVEALKALPSADAVDCTDFIEWLVDRVLDETIWENNSVAYGEIICRKLEELGVLEVTEEPSYYIRPSDDTKESYLNAFYDGFNTATLALHDKNKQSNSNKEPLPKPYREDGEAE